MITLVRKRAGVPDSCYYYNNDNESINAKIKQKIERKRNDWPAFVAILKEMELAQNRNGLVLVCGDAEVGKWVERSLFDEGPYRLKTELIALGASSTKFSTMTSHEKRAIIKKSSLWAYVLFWSAVSGLHRGWWGCRSRQRCSAVLVTDLSRV